MTDGFYLADITHKVDGSRGGGTTTDRGVLCFRQARSGFDGKADKEHVKNYAGLFGEFLKAHPDYVMPESFVKEEVGYSSVEVKPLPAGEVKPDVTPNTEVSEQLSKLLGEPKAGAEKIPASADAVEKPVNVEQEEADKKAAADAREGIKDPVAARATDEDLASKGKKK